ncbi:MAG TPA: alpha-L-fucosidase [Polyangiaceae bacterium]|nr:alpha-L-fucosidase [Polyangiaceae bacterium]
MTAGNSGASGTAPSAGGISGSGGNDVAGASSVAGGTVDTGGMPSGGSGQAGQGGTGGSVAATKSLDQLQRDYVDLRFGMFLHFGVLTYTGSWAQANLDISQFNPTMLDPGQWADAAKAAHMKFGVLTTRHHDGFALWDSKVSTFDVGATPWFKNNGGKDVVKEYVDAFRSRGLAPGLYYSVWDATQGIGNDTKSVTPAQLDYVKQQLTELLTNYGPIPILVLDGWSWKTGHNVVPYDEIRELVKSLQPDCLMTDHTHMADPWEVDIVNFEEPAGGFAPEGNTYPGNQDNKINSGGGNDWFWAPNISGLMSVSTIVDDHLKKLEPRWTNFLLNCPPNRDGLLDAAIVSRLAEVGGAWSPDTNRPSLPAQAPFIEHAYTPVSASSTSGDAANAIDGLNDTQVHTLWQTSGAFPQSLTLDLGEAKPDVGMLAYVPRYVNVSGGIGAADGAITSFGVLVSTDGKAFIEATSGSWAADGKMKTVTFGPVAARYVRLEVRAANGAAAVATEVTVGAMR